MIDQEKPYKWPVITEESERRLQLEQKLRQNMMWEEAFTAQIKAITEAQKAISDCRRWMGIGLLVTILTIIVILVV